MNLQVAVVQGSNLTRRRPQKQTLAQALSFSPSAPVPSSLASSFVLSSFHLLYEQLIMPIRFLHLLFPLMVYSNH